MGISKSGKQSDTIKLLDRRSCLLNLDSVGHID